MPRDHLRPVRPLSESEEYQLRQLLDRRAQSLPAAQEQRDRERVLEAKLQAKRDRLAADEARLSKRLAELRIDIDCVSAEIYKISPHATAFRHVAGRLQEYGDRVPNFSWFNTAADNLDRGQLMLLGEIALSLHAQATKPKGRPLRERMESVKVDIGPDAPGAGGPSDGKAEMAAAIIKAGRRRRGEE